jgi:hypothetical protein
MAKIMFGGSPVGGAGAPTTDAAKEGYVPTRLTDANLKAQLLPSTARGQEGGVAPLATQTGRVPVGKTPTGVRVGAWFAGYGDFSGAASTSPALITQLETDLNVPMDFIEVFQGISPGGSYTQWSGIKAFLDAGREVVLNLSMDGTLAQINAGQFDSAIDQFGAFVTGYAAANPGWKDTLIVKTLHEGNQTASYSWCVYAPANLTAAGGSVTASAANYVTAYQRVATRLRAAATANGKCYLQTVFEVGTTNSGGDPAQLDLFYPGRQYVDMVSINVYNRYGISSGSNAWARFGELITPTLEAVRRIAPGKPVMIGETSCTDGGYISGIQISTGGTGYAGTTTATITDPAGRGTGATVTPVVTGGVITGMTMTNFGRGYNFVSPPTVTLANTGGGTGATFAALVQGSKFSKAAWIRDAFEFVKNNTDITYLTWFLQNAVVATSDNRQWSLNTAAEKAAWVEGYGLLRGRVRADALAPDRHRSNVNLCPDPYGNDVSKWSAAGANVGTLSKSASLDNLPGDSDARNQSTSGAVTGDVTGCIRLSHAGVAGNAYDNRLRFPLAGKMINPNQAVTVSFRARFKRTSGSGSMYVLPAIESVNPFNLPQRHTPARLDDTFRRYRFTISSGDTNGTTNGWLISWCIGTSDGVGEFQMTDVKVEWGPADTPLVPSMRQIGRTTVVDTAYTYGVTGTTDELLAYTTLTAAPVG